MFGPKLLNLYINEICEVSRKPKRLFFQLLYLLRFVEAVNFINEQDCPPPAEPEVILRLFDHFSDFVGGRTGGRQCDKTSRSFLFTRAGNYVGKGRLNKKKKLKQVRAKKDRDNLETSNKTEILFIKGAHN